MTVLPRSLILVRHAKSDYPDGVEDHDRPLNGRGRRDAPEVGQWLGEHVVLASGNAPVVLVSSALRAQQTWALASARLPPSWSTVQPRREPRIYEASVGILLDLVSQTTSAVSTLILVGHNPGLVDLIESICVEDDLYQEATVKFPTSSVAVLACDREWAASTALPREFRLAAFAVPRG